MSACRIITLILSSLFLVNEAAKTTNGGYLWIINASSRLFKMTSLQNYKMVTWNFSDIPPQTMKRFYIEYGTDIHQSGNVTFQLDGEGVEFEIQICWPYSNSQCGIKVNWKKIDTIKYAVFPPSPQGENIGWIPNGYLSIIILEKGVNMTIKTIEPDTSSIVDPIDAIPLPKTFIKNQWMDYYSDILGRLTLIEMTLPGTHDSGTYHPLNVFGKPWTKTQDVSLNAQLNRGIRALDLRIGQKKPGDYVIVHNIFRTNYTLKEALKEVTDFIDSTSKEIVVLDFHRFKNLGEGSFDYDQLKSQIKSYLSGYYLHVSQGKDKPLKDIWASTGKDRVVVAWNTINPDSYMWPGVAQSWYQHAKTINELYDDIEKDMADMHSGMWATCSFTASRALDTPHENAVKLYPTITRWYYGGSKWCEKANIISVDFFSEYTNIIQASIISSLMKAGAKYM